MNCPVGWRPDAFPVNFALLCTNTFKKKKIKFQFMAGILFFGKNCKPGRDRGCVDELRNRKVSLLHPVELDMLANRVPGHV